MQPNKLTKKLNICVEKLYTDYQIVYKSSRGHDGRMIFLEKLESKCDDKMQCKKYRHYRHNRHRVEKRITDKRTNEMQKMLIL